ncbi:hypothetical protein [Pelagibacterium sp. H642]|uniref:hypothetical protein n=1 Tax=Pelagibacterium sp. H642 TaxID=1881069 RepID=UPI0028160C0D|nr:hypothetical protein [Pelagibacterium sp. H642]WMT90420.1 hypothetical protein NO934_16785 [Pelagibacterium sp. H642]
MTSLTGDTDVFTADVSSAKSRASVMFMSTRHDDLPGTYGPAERDTILSELDRLAEEGWTLTLRKVFDSEAPNAPCALATGFAHGHDVAGVFEAPDPEAALRGTIRLEKAGWARIFRTEWLIGIKEFAPVMGKGSLTDHDWAFLALWEWNDQWCEASEAARTEYDLECDIAFKGDLALGVNIAGRHRMDWSHGWHHLGAWEIDGPDTADAAIRSHEAVADFKFTTSRHIVGRIAPIETLIAPRQF